MSPEEVALLESVLWSMSRSFEELALTQYQEHAPELATPGKRAQVERLRVKAPSDEMLRSTPLAEPIFDLLRSAKGDATSTLLVQGLVLEQLGRLIYQKVEERPEAAADSKTLARQGASECTVVLEKLPSVIEARLGKGEPVFQAFVRTTEGVLARLDGLGEAVDAVFAGPFGIRFADLMGDFTAELLPMCMELGMERRKVIVHFTSALMSAG